MRTVGENAKVRTALGHTTWSNYTPEYEHLAHLLGLFI